MVYSSSYGEHHLICSTLKCSKEGENNRKHEWSFFHCFSLLYIAFASVQAAFTLVPRVRESEAEMHLLVVGWRFSGVRREGWGGLTETWREEGEFALCNTSTQPCLFSTPPPPLQSDSLSFFPNASHREKCAGPIFAQKWCWDRQITYQYLSLASHAPNSHPPPV